MIYATDGADARLIVAAADTVVEFDGLGTLIAGEAAEDRLHADLRFPNLLEMLQDDDFVGFKRAPMVFLFDGPESREAFIQRHAISVIGPKRIRSLQSSMIVNAAPVVRQKSEHPALREGGGSVMDEIAEALSDEARPGSIAALHGLDKDDPWDRRSPEERARMEAMKKALREAAEKGGLTNESFDGEAPSEEDGANGPDGKLVVTKVKVHEQRDGKIAVSGVEAHKIADDAVTEAVDEMAIRHDGPAALFHRINVLNRKLAEVEPVLLDSGFAFSTFAVDQRDTAQGCWIAVLAQRHANRMTDALVRAGIGANHETVNIKGEVLLPQGTTVVEEGDPSSYVRPWNDKAAWAALTDEQRAAEIKAIKGDEFIICGTRPASGNTWGCDVWITPRAWFNRERTLWGEPLDIVSGILPPDLKEISPGYFRATSRDWLTVSHDLNNRGMRESIMMQVAVNNA